MHAVADALKVIGETGLIAVMLVWMWAVYDALSRLNQAAAFVLPCYIALGKMAEELSDLTAVTVQLGTQLAGVRATLESVVRVEPTIPAGVTEAPQVPTPHGEAKTLLLMNANHTVAHEVSWHRDVPKTYAYGGRVFELLGQNESGQWEFLPC